MIVLTTESVEGGTGWYLVVLGQYNLVLLGIKWYWVDILYILKKVEIWSGVTIARRTNKERYNYLAIGSWKTEMSN